MSGSRDITNFYHASKSEISVLKLCTLVSGLIGAQVSMTNIFLKVHLLLSTPFCTILTIFAIYIIGSQQGFGILFISPNYIHSRSNDNILNGAILGRLLISFASMQLIEL